MQSESCLLIYIYLFLLFISLILAMDSTVNGCTVAIYIYTVIYFQKLETQIIVFSFYAHILKHIL